MALDIHRLCLLASVSIDMQWIPRDLNIIADDISKFVDLDDYSINDRVFYSLDELWGPHTCDRFACHYNAKLPKFNTRFYQPGTSGFSLEVSSLMDKLRSTVLASRAHGTSLNYTRIFNRWRSFATEVLGIVAVFPVEPIHCALFLQYLLDSTKSVSTINCAFYAFKWLHDLAGVGSPTSHPTVVAVKEGAIRLSSCPVKHRKEPLEAEHLRQLMERTDMNDLLQLRNLVMFVLAFSGFLRFSELSLIRAKDIKFSNGFISVFIEKSKADQLREGQSVVIAESGSSLCPVTLLKLYMNSSHLSLDSGEYIFRPISASNSCKRLVSVNKPISYSTYRQSFKKYFRDIVPDITNFSTHSAKSGGATGRWASVSAKNTYIKDSLASRLDVSKSLSL
ncbi:unnamed protein product [Porites lobata]|uniref:Tyr recombinase domain-containing protein n=1 Tax=Porites lobata TaxID=104759 RepID=A0ABN8S9R8_9CNID|nr:unnamed protein product [Porites lobata]